MRPVAAGLIAITKMLLTNMLFCGPLQPASSHPVALNALRCDLSDPITHAATAARSTLLRATGESIVDWCLRRRCEVVPNVAM